MPVLSLTYAKQAAETARAGQKFPDDAKILNCAQVARVLTRRFDPAAREMAIMGVVVVVRFLNCTPTTLHPRSRFRVSIWWRM
jgi:hypothetical protein